MYCGTEWHCKTCWTWSWKSSSLSFCTLAPGNSEDWEKTKARRKMLQLIHSHYGIFIPPLQEKYNQGKLIEAWVNLRGKGKNENKRKKYVHLVVAQYIFLLCWFVSISGLKKGEQPHIVQDRCRGFNLQYSKAWIQGVRRVCCSA